VSESDWSTSVDALRRRGAVPAAQATASLLERAEARWLGRVVARTSMHDLLFTLPGDVHPFTESVRVAWDEHGYEFHLFVEHGKVKAADRCSEANAEAVLDAFLMQLVRVL